MTERSEPMRLWGGRFAAGPSDALAALSASVQFDWRLAPYDLAGLTRARPGPAPRRAARRRRAGQDARRRSTISAPTWRPGRFVPTPRGRGRAHRARARAGRAARPARRQAPGRRSRATTRSPRTCGCTCATRARHLAGLVAALQTALLDQADEHVDAPAPGFTHLQHAQPVSFGHELAKHVHALARDVDRLRDWDRRAAFSPLGAGALAGSSLPLDPQAAARRAGLHRCGRQLASTPCRDRDFAAEFLFVAALLGRAPVPARRGGLPVDVDGSSAGPGSTTRTPPARRSCRRRRTPTSPSWRGASPAGSSATSTGLLATLKGLPFAYNRDLQEDKEPVFDAVDTLALVLPAVTGMVATLHVRHRSDGGGRPGRVRARHRRRRVAGPCQGVPFREAHEIAGACVRTCEQRGIELVDLTDADLRAISPAPARPTVRDVLTVEGVARRPLGVRRHRSGPGARAAGRGCVRSSPRAPTWAGRPDRPGASAGRAARGVLRATGRWRSPRRCWAASLRRTSDGGRAADRGRGVRRTGDDPASHAHRGRTPRNAVMFGAAGPRCTSTSPTACTGASNVVCRPGGAWRRAVLLRAGEVVDGVARGPRPPARRPARRATWPAARPG